MLHPDGALPETGVRQIYLIARLFFVLYYVNSNICFQFKLSYCRSIFHLVADASLVSSAGLI